MNESVKQANVLTEEEISHRSYQFYGDYIGSIMTPISYKYTEEIIKSHRFLNSRNANLVHENDELMAENVKLKQALIDVWEVDTSDWEEAVRKQYSIIDKALEEITHD